MGREKQLQKEVQRDKRKREREQKEKEEIDRVREQSIKSFEKHSQQQAVPATEESTPSISESPNIAATIIEYSASFSVIRSDKEDDDADEDDTKMCMTNVQTLLTKDVADRSDTASNASNPQ